MAGMPFFAKHWLQRLCLGGAGVLISAFGPEQVPGTYKPLLFWFGIALAVLAVLIWPMLERASTILRRRRMQSSDLPIVVEPAPKPHRMASVEDIRDIVSGLTFDIARKRTE